MHAELLADDREDEVGVRLGQVERSSAPTRRARGRTARPSRARSGPGRPGSPRRRRGPTGRGTRSAARAGRPRVQREDQSRAAIATRRAIAPGGAAAGRRRRASPASWPRSTSAVPRSGCEATSTATTRRRRASSGSSSRERRGAARALGQEARRVEDERELRQLATAGTCSGPAPSQRRAPLTSTPTPGT